MLPSCGSPTAPTHIFQFLKRQSRKGAADGAPRCGIDSVEGDASESHLFAEQRLFRASPNTTEEVKEAIKMEYDTDELAVVERLNQGLSAASTIYIRLGLTRRVI